MSLRKKFRTSAVITSVKTRSSGIISTIDISSDVSLNKRKTFRSNAKIGPSFGYHFGDDLCEEILQYLPLRDKLRLECVSKQFQRTVFQRQQSIEFDELRYDQSGRYHRRQYYQVKFNVGNLETLLKKCGKIRKFKFPRFIRAFTPEEGNRLVELFLKYCCNLTEISCSLESFGPYLGELGPIINKNSFLVNFEHGYDNRPDQLTPQQIIALKESLSPVKELSLTGSSSIPLAHRMELKNLKIFEFTEYHISINDSLSLLDNNKSVKYFNLCGLSSRGQVLKVFGKSIFEGISKLKDLVELKFTYNVINKSFVNEVKQIALKCTQLKSISCILEINSMTELIEGMSLLKNFQNLKRLELRINYQVLSSQSDEELSFCVFNDFGDLTHLTLSTDFLITDGMLSEMAVYLPKLQYLNFGSYRQFWATKSKIEIFCRFSRLQEVYSTVKFNDKYRRLFKTKLLNNCPKIRRIGLWKEKKRF